MTEKTRSKILIVDDTKLIVKILTDYLSPDYEIISSDKGDDAFEMIKNESPDLILLDVIMPFISGIEVCKTLKTNKKTVCIPVIMVTALSKPADRIQCIEAGADDFITKPIDKLELTIKVKSLLRIKRLQDKLVEERDRLLIKNRILSVMTELVPKLMIAASEEQQKIVILQIIDKVEWIIWESVWEKLPTDAEKLDIKYLADTICETWNQLGGSFSVENVEGSDKFMIKGIVCPWGSAARNNPILCQITKGVITRIASKTFPDSEVSLISTIGNNDPYCHIDICQ